MTQIHHCTKNMVRYRIKLTKEEVEELISTINKNAHTSQSFRAAYVLLNCNEGEHSQKDDNKQINKVLRTSMRAIDRIEKVLSRKVWN